MKKQLSAKKISIYFLIFFIGFIIGNIFVSYKIRKVFNIPLIEKIGKGGEININFPIVF